MVELLCAGSIGLVIGFVLGIVFGAALWQFASDGTSQGMVAAISQFGEAMKSALDNQDERIDDLECAVYSDLEPGENDEGGGDNPFFRPFRKDDV